MSFGLPGVTGLFAVDFLATFLMVWGGLSLIWMAVDAVWRYWNTHEKHRLRGRASILSLLVVTDNCGETIEGFLRQAALMLASRVSRFEIVVVDNDSRDDTAAVVERLARTEPRIRCARATGAPVDAIDLGLVMCRSPLVIVARVQNTTEPRELLAALSLFFGQRMPTAWQKEESAATL